MKREKTFLGFMVFLLALSSTCGPETATGDCAAVLTWNLSGSVSFLRGELTGLLETVELTVQAGQNVLGSQSCPYEDYRCVVHEVPAGGGRRLTVRALGAGQQLLYRGSAESVEVKKDQLVEVPVTMTPAYAQDIYPPAAIDDLTATANGTTVMLTWTAVGDDVRAGRASAYIVKYSSSEINESNFDAANSVDGPPPKASGGAESLLIGPLAAATLYYFAVKVSDNAPAESGNISPISNIAQATTGN